MQDQGREMYSPLEDQNDSDVESSSLITPSLSGQRGYDQYLPYLLFRNPVFLRWLLAFPLQLKVGDLLPAQDSDDEAPLPEVEATQKTSRLWVSGSNMPLWTPHSIHRAFLGTEFVSGFQFVSSTVWPLGLASITLHDLLHYYLYSEDRYGYSLSSTLIGSAPIEAAWNSHYGADLVSDWRYPIALSLLLASPIASGLVQALYHQYYRLSAQSSYTNLENFSNTPSIKQDIYTTLFPWNRYARAIEQGTFRLLWDQQQSLKDKEDYLNALIETTRNHGGLAYVEAIQALSKIAEGMDEGDLDQLVSVNAPISKIDQSSLLAQAIKTTHQALQGKNEEQKADLITSKLKSEDNLLLFTPENSSQAYPEEKQPGIEGLQNLKWKAVDHLQTLAAEGSCFARYELWTINRLKQTYFEPLFWLWGMYALYAKVRAIQLIYIKTRGWYEYTRDKNACTAEDKIFKCLNQIEACICAVCADWAEASHTGHQPSIHYALSDNIQACLTALLSKQQSPEQILATLPRLLGRLPNPATILDLSAQNTPLWDFSTWDEFLTLLENHQPDWDTFNVSSSTLLPFTFSDDQLVRLHLFLNRSRIGNLDLSGLQLTAVGFTKVVSDLDNISWAMLDISRNKLMDAGIASLADLLPQLGDLTSLRLSGNEVSDDGAALLAEALNETTQALYTLTQLDISDNLAGDAGLVQLLSVFYNRSLISLDVSGLPLTPSIFAALSPLLPQLRQFRAVNSYVTDEALAALEPASTIQSCEDKEEVVLHYDLSNNPFSDVGVNELLSVLPERIWCNETNETNATARWLANPAISMTLGYTQITDASLPKIADALMTKNIVGIHLSGTLITTYGVVAALPGFCQPHTALSDFTLSDMPLSEDVIEVLAELLSNSSCRETLIALDLSRTGITGTSVASLFKTLPQTHLETLLLSDNPLSDTAFNTLDANQTLPLCILDLSNTGLDGKSLTALVILFGNSPNLTHFDLSHNDLGPGAGIQFAEQLLTPAPPHLDSLSDVYMPRDVKRLLGFQTPLEQPSLEPATPLQALYLTDTGLDTKDARALCRVSYRGGFFASGFRLQDAAIDETQVNPDTCEISAATQTTVFSFLPTLLFLGWVFPVIGNLFRIDSRPRRDVTPADEKQNASDKTTFFGPAPQLPPPQSHDDLSQGNAEPNGVASIHFKSL